MIDIKICKGSVSTTRPGHVIPTILQFSGAIRIQEVDFPDGKNNNHCLVALEGLPQIKSWFSFSAST
jgi:hypothetical protein